VNVVKKGAVLIQGEANILDSTVISSSVLERAMSSERNSSAHPKLKMQCCVECVRSK
jgi:hypothetical protein